MESQNRKPRWNPWPVSIVCFFALAITGAVVFVIFCNANPSDLVTRDYYEQELQFQGQIDRAQRANQLPQSASMDYDSSRNVLTLAVPKPHALQGATGQIHFYRPSAAGMDQRVTLDLDPDGKQEVSLAKLSPGLWKVKVLWSAGGQEFFIDRKLVIPNAS
ncbi:MAG TPA: FixH family protein [Clostridia bacterium]|nr:FixH family protein [Clostridia bacterium]